MIAIILLSTVSALAMGAFIDMALNGDDAEENANKAIEVVDDVTQNNGFDLLDLEIPTTLMDQIDAGTTILDDDFQRDQYAPTGTVEIDGTDEADVIDANEDVEVTFGQGGNDTIFGADHDQVIFGDDGDDVIFGEGGDDQLFGEDGNDSIFSGQGDDLIVSYDGDDVLFGDEGDDTFILSEWTRSETENSISVVSGGSGEDGITLEIPGPTLIELGEGDDDVLVFTKDVSGDSDPVAIITDFAPADDQILLGVYDADFTSPDGTNTLEITYSLTSIQTSQGPATLVVPSVEDEELLATLSPDNIGYAILLGVEPSDIEEGNIRVIISNDESRNGDDDSIHQIYKSQRTGVLQ